MPLIRNHTRLALSSIRANRTRSFLTCLGIAIGIASITLILSLTGSISHLIASELRDGGSDLIVVRPATSKDTITSLVESITSTNLYQRSNLATSDIPLISGLDHVAAVAPIAISTNTITAEDNTVASATILGTTPAFANIESLSLRHGTFISSDNGANAVVVGHMLSLLLFNTSNPVGRTLTFQGQRFIVVGVLSEVTDTFNFNSLDYNNALIMDISTLESLFGSPQIQQINVRVTTPNALGQVAKAIATSLEQNHSGDTNFSVSYGNDLTHPANSLLDIASGMLAVIASISLLIGGIGVMNIMLVSVAERSHEIGIRKAVGASSSNILMQFMIESIILSVFGGLLGIALGYLAAFLVSVIMPFSPYISIEIILIALLIPIVIGIVFGTYPALKAASKDPIESLRHNR